MIKNQEFLNVSLVITQLAQDGHIANYNVTMDPLMASAMKQDGTVLMTFAEISEFYNSIYCA